VSTAEDTALVPEAPLPLPRRRAFRKLRWITEGSRPLASLFFLWLVALTVVPLLLLLAVSLTQKVGGPGLGLRWSLDSYARILDPLYLQVFVKTVGVAGVATVTCLVLGFPVAYALSKFQGRARSLGLLLMFLPFWTNFILRVYGTVSLFGNYGLLNQLLLRVGLVDEPIRILYTRLGVFLGLVYNYLPFLVVPIFAALEKLDPDLEEAAQDLGANRWTTLRRVVLPNVREGIGTGCLFVFVPMLGEYVIPDTLGGAREAFLGNVMVSQFFAVNDWPFGAAIAGMMTVLLLSCLWMLGSARRAREARYQAARSVEGRR
jgi:spermidine/putrescine transport system permease protein